MLSTREAHANLVAAVDRLRGELRAEAVRLARKALRLSIQGWRGLAILFGNEEYARQCRDWLTEDDERKRKARPVMGIEKEQALSPLSYETRYGMLYGWPQGCRGCREQLRVMFACRTCGEVTCIDCECRCYREGGL